MVLIILALAGIGLINILITNPSSLFMYLGIIVVSSIVLFTLFRFIQNRTGTGNRLGSKYRQAVKQSKKMHGKSNLKKAKRKRTHLTVIDGKKDKKKNGAV
ncbi:hypothetical protein CIB95_04530 [Lottiidibacillus patelloidae]|uniref:Uncharacterized protein n=1 Tax=Lottiidibacillus patelloidae TaxID=2670334 RepID=A0A263BXU9_9BACI|nr:hypothetical protein CIB95_04530 [Lottiidibacillus patelloidae]